MNKNNGLEFIFLHIKKAGGTNLRNILTEKYVETDRDKAYSFYQVPKSEWNDVLNNARVSFGDYDYKRMLYAKKFLYTKEEFNNAFKFTFVRNPYERAVSSWRHVILTNRRYPFKRYLRKLSPKLSFLLFLRSLPKIWETKKDRVAFTHTAPIFPDITDENGNVLMDYIGRLEDFEKDIYYILNKLNFEQKVNLYKKKHSKGKFDYRNFYTKESFDLATHLFYDDIVYFDYSF